MFLSGVEATAVSQRKPLSLEPAGPRSLRELVSLVTILEVGRIVNQSYSQRSAHEDQDGAVANAAGA